jgi:Na+/proline symporter
LFLLQRGLSTGITIYAPSIVLSHILEIDIRYAIFMIGGLVILYTVYGGTKAVSYTQMFQMAIIFSGLLVAAAMVVTLLPEKVSFINALQVSGKLERLNILDFKWDLNNKYNFWSGLIGGFFLQLSYFGTDQSQVGRYLTGSSVGQSRLGLIMNGLVKIPMQFFILMIGVLVFSFYQFHEAPIYFNKAQVNKVLESPEYADSFKEINANYESVYREKIVATHELSNALEQKNEAELSEKVTAVKEKEVVLQNYRTQAIDIISKNDPLADKNDSNYVFLSFVTSFLPVGLIGLLIAIIFLASMGSTASGLNSLASTSVVDIYKRWLKKDGSEKHYLLVSRLSTILWGVLCIVVALNASKLGNLLEAVNILGSLFYGTILGIFLVAFYMKRIIGNVVFIAAVITQAIIFYFYKIDVVSYLWLNVIGCLLVMTISAIIQLGWNMAVRRSSN